MKYDVIIVGAGIAGLYCAINLAPELKALLLSKSAFTTSNTALAQGGIAFGFDSAHYEDTLKAGNYENNRDNVRIMTEESVNDYKSLVELGVIFEPELALEGGHSLRRIAHCKDSTGYEIVTALLAKVKSLPNIEMLENVDFTDISVSARAIVLATGGIGQVYTHTTNSMVATGDGIYIAHRLGAKVERMDLIQFHPTAFNNGELLLTEALRGEGARLLNENMESFSDILNLELQPRDVVSHAILAQNSKIYLDISHKDPDYIISRFPMIYQKLLKHKLDLTRQPIPVYPCQHYLMGGISVNSLGQTTVPGVYAIGECAFTGVHGSNRLASNSLAEGLVFSRRCARHINSSRGLSEIHTAAADTKIPEAVVAEIRSIMQKSYFVTPDYESCRKNLIRLAEINKIYNNPLATTAYLILKEVIKNAP